MSLRHLLDELIMSFYCKTLADAAIMWQSQEQLFPSTIIIYKHLDEFIKLI